MNMAKPKMYGQAAHYNPNLWRGVRDRRQHPGHTRPSKNAAQLVARQIAKEKEAAQ
jgi:hypothetical protein